AQPDKRLDPTYLVKLIHEQKVAAIITLPPILQLLLTEPGIKACQSLRTICCGGDVLTLSLQQHCHEQLPATLYNAYGPTEAAMHSIAWVCHPDDERAVVPIGRPIANTQIYILDSALQPVPVGVAGELYIGGEGLARGYLGDPALTTQKFIHDPFSREPGRRLYKTGDRARYLADGNIDFLGRMDHQVIIRGFRIELGDIEANLTRHPKVQEAKVVVFQEPASDDKYLVAYVISSQRQEVTADELRHFLISNLPKYMIPSFFVPLEQFPRTSSGKIDQRNLPLPSLSRSENTDFIPPQGPVELQLTQVWEEVLGKQPIGVRDDFFDLGGHSLLATQLMSRLSQTFQVELPLRRLFEAPTIAGLADYINERQSDVDVEAAPVQLPAVVPAPEQRYHPFPLTDVQHAYWLGRSEAFELGNISTHGYMEFDCWDLDVTRLNHAWQKLIERHDMLRMIVLPDGQQQILETVPAYQIPVLNLIELAEAEQTERLTAIRQEMSHEILTADQWPLFNMRATRLDSRRIRLHISLDALIADAWSLFTLFKEWTRLYHTPVYQLPALTLSFRDYILTEQKLAETALYQRSKAYWFDRLDTLPPAPELPLAQNPALIAQPQFKRRTFRLDQARWQALKQRATQAGLTPTGTLLAAFAGVLALWSKQPKFTLNLTLFNRLPLHPQVNEIVGDFTSLALLEVDYSASVSFTERARRLQQQLWADLDHRYVSGVRVQRELARRRGGPQNAVMPVVFTSALAFDLSDQDTALVDDFGEMVYSIGQTPQVWLDHQVVEQAGALVYNWDAVEQLFPEGMLDDMFETYGKLLQQLADDESAWVALRQPPLPAHQLAQRAEVNTTAAPISAALLHTLFLEQMESTPNAPAVISPELTLTYHQLYRRANQVGHWLRQHGAQPNNLVAVVMEKGWEQVVAVLGIHLAGAAYLPIDPGLPTERRHYLLDHGDIDLVLTQNWLDGTLIWPSTIRRLCVDTLVPDDSLAPLTSVQQPTDLAYVIYTSGSTGLPKGVAIDHRGAVNTVLDINRRFGVTAADRVLALSALNFDLSVYDIFGLLAAGGAIVMPLAASRTDPAHWLDLMTRYNITVWNTVPALMQMLVDTKNPAPRDVDHEPPSHSTASALQVVMLSGDWIPVSLPNRIRALWPETKLYSLGGATEASIWSIYYPIAAVDPAWASIPYGRPLTNQAFHVLDEHLKPRPVWVAGELYIGGIGLAQGYWRNEEKTNARFILHPNTGERLYKTGDLGRYLPDGNIEFLGREDFQVKIRGHRIELGEIETALLQHPHIKEAVVAAVGEPRGHRQLVAYVVPQVDTGPADIILDPLERLEFKFAQPGLRRSESTELTIDLPATPFDDGVTHRYLARQSYRHFQATPIAWETLSRFLGCLRQMPVTDAPLPKYRYPSAGSLYPVQTYLYLKPNQIDGIGGGFYYYHPAHHHLVLLDDKTPLEGKYYDQNQPIFESAAFALFQIGHLDAIEPMYGDRSRDFCLLEAGYMGQLLMEEAPAHEIGLCPIGWLEFDAFSGAMGLSANQVLLHSFLGGNIAPTQMTQWSTDEPTQGKNNAIEQLESYLQQKLPAYMIPSAYIPIETLPLTPNGKVDRQALPAPEPKTTAATLVLPQTDVERTLATMVQAVLQIDQIGIHHNFFDLGADSVHLVQLRNKLQETWGRDIPMVTLFNHPTISDLAQYLTEQTREHTNEETDPPQEVWSPLVALQPKGSAPPFFCIHPLLGVVFPYLQLAHSLDRERPFYGLQAVGLDGKQPPYTCFQDMAAHHIKAIRVVQPDGPYFLGGWSLGSWIAFEMAQQLQEAGEEVALLAIIDTEAGIQTGSYWQRSRSALTFTTVIVRDIWPFVRDYFSLVTERTRPTSALDNDLSTIPSGPPLSSLKQPIVGDILKVWRANMRALSKYSPQPYSGTITVFRATEQNNKKDGNPYLNWDTLASNVTAIDVPGNHFTTLREPNVKVLAQQLQQCINSQYGINQ
ncbi:MAG: amino acid adenylation domain-containing protein, partial [Anaerolineae bacterium]|nr:amino acid adenylation domain-containing protein [Anaerolineae bacterium]